MTSLTLDQLGAEVEKAVESMARNAVKGAAYSALDRAISMSSGPFSLAELAEMDHPYARRHGTPLLEPFIINVQSGAFRQDWDMRQVGDQHFQVFNDNAVADYLDQGTRYMFRRPIAEAVELVTEKELNIRQPFRWT